MACGRSVVATSVGGPPEFVTPAAGVLVDPTDEDALVDASRAQPRSCRARTTPRRAAAETHDVETQAERIEAVLERAAGA